MMGVVRFGAAAPHVSFKRRARPRWGRAHERHNATNIPRQVLPVEQISPRVKLAPDRFEGDAAAHLDILGGATGYKPTMAKCQYCDDSAPLHGT